jgi:AbrB family looped-hinge helix DNA binding protein
MKKRSETTVRRQWAARVGGGGRVVIPADLRQTLGVRAGDVVVFESNGEGVRLRPQAEMLRELQDKYRRRWRKPAFSVDAFLAQRKAEWGEE